MCEFCDVKNHSPEDITNFVNEHKEFLENMIIHLQLEDHALIPYAPRILLILEAYNLHLKALEIPEVFRE